MKKQEDTKVKKSGAPTVIFFISLGYHVIFIIVWIVLLTIYSTEIVDIFDSKQIKNYFKQIQEVAIDYNTDLLSDIQILPIDQECPGGYDQNKVFTYTYYGIKKGCECNPASFTEKVKEGRCCKSNEDHNENVCNKKTNECVKLCGCQGVSDNSDIEQIDKQQIYGWPMYNKKTELYQLYKGCIKRQKGYNFNIKQPKQDNSGNLKCDSEEDQLCVNIICFPKTVNCPISEIIFSDKNPNSVNPGEYTEKIIGADLEFKMYVKNMISEKDKPVLEFAITQGEGVCTTEKNNYDAGRASYPLEEESRSQCSDIDQNSYKYTGLSVGENIFYKSTNVSLYNKLDSLPYFEKFDNKYKFKHYVEIQNSNFDSMPQICKQQLQVYLSIDQELKDIKDKEYKDMTQMIMLIGILYTVGPPFLMFPLLKIIYHMKKKENQGCRTCLIGFFTIIYLGGVITYMVFASNSYKDFINKIYDYQDKISIPILNKCPQYEQFELIQNQLYDMEDITTDKFKVVFIVGLIANCLLILLLAIIGQFIRKSVVTLFCKDSSQTAKIEKGGNIENELNNENDINIELKDTEHVFQENYKDEQNVQPINQFQHNEQINQ